MEIEETYTTLYLYNTLLEYVYFIIIFLQVKGPVNLNDLIQHTHFFKRDVYRFIEIFSGKDISEKLGNMLCTTTHTFEVNGKVLHLKKNFLSFKQVICEDLIVTKVIDLILRGIHTVKSVCQNLNMSNVISIQEDSLLAILNRFPYFNLDSDPSLIVLQVHGVLGFDACINKTVVNYFQSYLQNINKLSYKEINFHSRFVPSCAIRNSLVIFCVLRTSAIFKCKNDNIYLRRKIKRESSPKQTLNMDELSVETSDSIAIGLLVLKAHGPVLRSWKGEISVIKKDSGFIQCVVNFTNGSQGIFEIYFYKVALKYISEIESLEDFLNVRDIVEFEATFCDIAAEQGRFWEATSVKVIKQGLQKSGLQHKADVNKYIENINLDYHQLKTASKSCDSKHCLGDYVALVKDVKISNKLPKSKPSDNDLKLVTKDQPSLNHASLLVHDSNQNVLPMKSENQNEHEKGLEIPDNLSQDKGMSLDEERAPKEREESFEDGISVPNFLFLDTSFMFGEIIISSQDAGVAVSMHRNKQCDIYFKYEAIFFYNLKSIPKKGSQVLLFVPCTEEQSNFLVATLVYLLDREETILVQKPGISVENFLVKHFMTKVKMSLQDSYSCYCQLLHSLQIKTKTVPDFEKCREIVLKCFDSLNLKDLVLFNEKTFSQLKLIIKMIYIQNLEMDLSELCKHMTGFCLNVSSSIRHSKKLNRCHLYTKAVHRLQLKQRKSVKHRSAMKKIPDNETSPSDVNVFPESHSCDHKESMDGDKCAMTKPSKFKSRDAVIQNRTYLMPVHASCSSTSSYTSCISKCSSDDTFYSCESLSESESDLETKDCKENLILNTLKIDETETLNSDCKLKEKNDAEIKNPYAGINGVIKIQVDDCNKNRIGECASVIKPNHCLKPERTFPLKHVSKKRYQILIPSKNYFCKKCYKPPLETIAYISTITKSSLFFSVKISQQSVILHFPRCLIPQVMQKFIKLNALVKIHVIPNALLNLSHVSCMLFCKI